MAVVGDFQRWRANCVPTRSDGKNTEIYGKWLIGDVYSNAVGNLDAGTYTELSEPMRCQIVTGVVYDEQRRHTIDNIDLAMETGLGATADITMEKSEDGQRNWSTARTRSMGTGTAQVRVRWNVVGGSRQSVFRFTIDDAVKRVFLGLYGKLRGRAH